MWILLYPMCVTASLTATMIAVIAVNWWVPLLADEAGNLPRRLRWFQTFDATLDAGWLDGYLDPSWGSTPWRRYWARVWWLNRNPAYGFDYAVGLTFDASEWRVVKYVERDDLVLFIAFGRGFNFYYEGPLGQYKLGWKAWNRWDGKGWDATNWEAFERIPVCFTVNPFRRRPA
ncbi:hypothetical protein PEP31012_00848 [Pandoraea eparura]|uniref:Uncharacterized protein n=1 Tax=Pandoraea eparura TaxID=2508291 RepID=A0A5E4SJI9_9BURK|nr:hypothetical protein [Pandoraea eparura]VVD76086.1 hypothetical protein PEP31012_00848 [Pandoraea eparura]